MTCWRRLAEWTGAGVWPRLHEVLLTKLRGANALAFSRAAVGGSHIRELLIAARTAKEPFWYTRGHEYDDCPLASGLARRAPAASVDTPSARVAGQGDRRRSGHHARCGQPVAQTRPRRRRGGTVSVSPARPRTAAHSRATHEIGRAAGARSGGPWVYRPGVDHQARRRGDPGRLWCELSFGVCQPAAPQPALDSPEAAPSRHPAQRGGHRGRDHRVDSGPRKKAQDEERTLVWVDESGFYPLPATVRTYAPCGHTPILRVPLTRDHLSAISAITPAGQLLLQVKAQALRGPDMVRFLRHLLRPPGVAAAADPGPDPAGSATVAWAGEPGSQSRGVVPRPDQVAGGVVDLRPGGRRGADEQCRRARPAAGGAVAQGEFRLGERRGQSVRGAAADGGSHLPATRTAAPGLPGGR
jgi:hypothetical protein